MRILLLASLVINLSCARATFRNGESQLSTRDPPSASHTVHFLGWGMFGIGNEIHENRYCPDRPAEWIETQMGTGDLIWTVLTFGIYSRRTVNFWCTIREKKS